jgi:WD40 repeat protein
VWTLPKLAGPVGFSTFSPDGQWVATTSGAGWQDHDIWNVARGERTVETIRNFGFARDLQFSPDGRWIALCGVRDAQVLDARTGRFVSERMRHDSHILYFEFSRDGKQIATASFDRTARVWEAATGYPLIPALRHTAPVSDVCFSPDGALLLTADDRGTARLWGLRSNGGERLALGKRYAKDPQVRLSPDGRNVLVFMSELIEVWDTGSGHLSFTWKEADSVTAACFSRDSRRVAIATTNGMVRLRELETGTEIFCVAHAGTVRCLEFSPDGQRLLTAGDGGVARVWNAADGTPLTPAMLHAGPVRHATFSPDGRQVVTGSDDKTMQVWDAKSGALVGESIQLLSRVMSAALNADGTRILTVRNHVANSESGATQLWDAATRRPLGPEQTLLGPGWYPAAFSPDGRRYLMLQDVTTVAICDAKTGRRTAPLLEHKHLPTGFAFSPDGRLVLTRADRFARIWDAETGEPVSPPLPHNDPVFWADWNPDGREIVTCSIDGKIHIWDVSPASAPVSELIRLAELMAAHRLDPQIGTVPLTTAEMKARWREQRR